MYCFISDKKTVASVDVCSLFFTILSGLHSLLIEANRSVIIEAFAVAICGFLESVQSVVPNVMHSTSMSLVPLW